MKIFFPSKKPEDIMAMINDLAKKHNVLESLSISQDNNTYKISFSKLGRSEVEVLVTSKENGFQYEILREKIAFLHQPFVKQMKDDLPNLVKQLGAVLLED